ncbi:peptidase M19 [Chakrabartia godavariana]|nr:peptidase M19 [Chakrabartia godavariana]
MRRIAGGFALLLLVAVAAFFLFAPKLAEESMNKVVPTSQKISARAEALHKTLFIADMHSDTLMWKRSLRDPATRGHVDLPRLEAGHVGLQVFSSVTKTPKGQNYDANPSDTDNITALAIGQMQPPRTWTSLLERSLWHAEKLKRAEADSKGALLIVRSGADLDRLVQTRGAKPVPVGALLSIEGLQNLEGKSANLDVLFKAGFRMAGFAHFFDNEVAGSMHGMKKGGLTPLGRQVLADMEAKGMVVDIAHCSHQCVAEILAAAKRPVVSSHGGVQATCKVNRNLTDDEIRGVARTGGVIGIGYWDAAICSTDPRAIAKAMRHVRDLVGIDHVGLGSDFDGATTTPFDTAGLAHVTQALIDEGFSDADIAKVMGGNVLRVLKAVLPPR